MTAVHSLPQPVRLLGLSGILPQLLCLALALMGTTLIPPGGAQAAGLAYAALILSFLGGLWWMGALQQGVREFLPYLLSVLPSLIGWAVLGAQAAGADVTRQGLLLVGLCLLLSPMVDRGFARRIPMPPGWITLRRMMATGLGLATLALALV